MLQVGFELGSRGATWIEEEGTEKDTVGVGENMTPVRAFSFSSSPQGELQASNCGPLDILAPSCSPLESFKELCEYNLCCWLQIPQQQLDPAVVEPLIRK